MSLRVLILVLLAVAFLALAPAGARAAQDEVTLRFKWTEGQTLRYRMTQDTEQRMTMQGQQMVNTSNTATDMRMVTDAVDADGVATVSVTIDRVRMRMQTPMMPATTVDTETDDRAAAANNPLAGPIWAMKDAKMTMVIEPSGRVRSFKGMDEVFDAMGPAGQTAKATSGDDAMRRNMEAYFRAIPEKPVRPGDSWPLSIEQPLPGMGTLVMDSTMTIGEPRTQNARRLAPISMTGTVKLDTTRKGDPLPGMPEMSATLGDARQSGETLFDLELGQIVRSNTTSTMPMTIRVNAGGQAMTMAQNMTMQMSMELLPDAGDNAGPATPQQRAR